MNDQANLNKNLKELFKMKNTTEIKIAVNSFNSR